MEGGEWGCMRMEVEKRDEYFHNMHAVFMYCFWREQR